jgi:hypothetical protein
VILANVGDPDVLTLWLSGNVVMLYALPLNELELIVELDVELPITITPAPALLLPIKTED